MRRIFQVLQHQHLIIVIDDYIVVDIELVVKVYNVYLHGGHLRILKVLVALLVVRYHALERATGQHTQKGLLLVRNYAMLLHLDAWSLIKVLGLRVIHQERGSRMILLAHIFAAPLLDSCLASLRVD